MYAIGGTTALLTDPYVTTGGVQDEGRIYRGGTPANPSGAGSSDGLPSNYLLGATGGPTSFDTQAGFDTQFGTAGDIGAFKFNSLTFNGGPASVSTTGGPTNLALIAINAMADGTAGSFDLNGLGQVLLATQAGPITFTSGLTFVNSGTGTAPTLTLYARGGELTVGSMTAFNLPGSAVNLYSDTQIRLDGAVGSATLAGAGAVNVISGGALTVGGLLHTSGSVSATTVAGGGDLSFAPGSAVTTDTGDLLANSGGALTAGGTILTGGNVLLLAANGLQVNGNVSAGGTVSFSATGGGLGAASGTLVQTPGSFLATANAGTLTLNGTIGADTNNPNANTPASATLSAGGGITLNGDLRATNSVTVSATAGGVTQTAGALVVTGTTAQGTPSPGALSVTASGGISLTAGSMTARAATLSTTGAVNQAGGHTLQTISDDIGISSTAGALTLAGTVNSAGNATLSSGGATTVNGSLTAQEHYASLPFVGGQEGTVSAASLPAAAGGRAPRRPRPAPALGQ